MPLPKKVKDIVGPLNLIPHPEGGFFVETYRSGSEPMSTMGQTGLDCEKPDTNLVVANGRSQNRPDGDERRNAMTSIFWLPTYKSPKQILLENASDHVHYYQGGAPFTYFLFDPATQEFSKITLGPELHKGHSLQVICKGKTWKCGRAEFSDGDDDDEDKYNYSLIGEAVAPGFDYHDFRAITEEDLKKNVKDKKILQQLGDFLDEISNEFFAEFYEDGEQRKTRVNKRA